MVIDRSDGYFEMSICILGCSHDSVETITVSCIADVVVAKYPDSVVEFVNICIGDIGEGLVEQIDG